MPDKIFSNFRINDDEFIIGIDSAAADGFSDAGLHTMLDFNGVYKKL